MEPTPKTEPEKKKYDFSLSMTEAEVRALGQENLNRAWITDEMIRRVTASPSLVSQVQSSQDPDGWRSVQRHVRMRELENGREFRIGIERLEDFGATIDTRAVHEFPWEHIVGIPREGCERNVEYDIRTREYLILDILIPGVRFQLEVAVEQVWDMAERYGYFQRQSLSIQEMSRMDWSRHGVPRGMRLVHVDQDYRSRTYRITFEAPDASPTIRTATVRYRGPDL